MKLPCTCKLHEQHLVLANFFKLLYNVIDCSLFFLLQTHTTVCRTCILWESLKTKQDFILHLT